MTRLDYQHTCDELNKLRGHIATAKKAKPWDKLRAAECALDSVLVVFDQLNRRLGQLEGEVAAMKYPGRPEAKDG